jgi:hypothetical protein
MFVEKTQEEIDNMTAKELGAYLESKRAHEIATLKASFEAEIAKIKADGVDKSVITEMTTKQGALLKELERQALVVKKITETVKSDDITENDITKMVNKYISENHEEIKKVFEAKTGTINLTLKAVGTVDTGSATNPSPGVPSIAGVQMAPPTNINLRTAFIETLTTTLNTSLAAYPYTESLPKDGNFDFVAEKGEKPQVDLKIETRYAQPVKVAGWIKLTDESVQDIPGLQSIANDLLRKKHDLKRQKGILFGDGNSPNPKGATVYGRTFVAGAMAGKIVSPNFMDVVNATITDIYTTHNFTDEMPYMANLVMINPMDFFTRIVGAKTLDGLPLYPSASLFNRLDIGGVTIIPHYEIPVGKIFTADMSMYNTTRYKEYNVQIGWVNDDFIHNQFVILGESRFHAFVRKLDEQAFIYDDIATIEAAITAS